MAGGLGRRRSQLAGEGHQSNASMPAALHVFQDGQLGPLQPAGCDIRSQHAARAVQHEQDVLPEQIPLLRLLPPLRAGQRQPDPCHRQDQHRLFDGAPGRAVRASQFGHEFRRSQLCQLFSPRPSRIPLQGQQHQGRQHGQPQPLRLGEMWMGEVHALNDEGRMTNDEGSPNDETLIRVCVLEGLSRCVIGICCIISLSLRRLAFVIPSSFVIRPSSFNQGTLLSRVFASNSSRASSPNAASKGHWYKGL